MRIKITFTLLVCLFGAFGAQAQRKASLTQEQWRQVRRSGDRPVVPAMHLPLPGPPAAARVLDALSGETLAGLLRRSGSVLQRWGRRLDIERDPQTGLPVMIRGDIDYLVNKFPGKSDLENHLYSYLDAVGPMLGIRRAIDEFVVTGMERDALGQTHIRLQQRYQGLDVYGAEIRLHVWDNRVRLFNGRYFPTASLPSIRPKFSDAAAVRTASEHVRRYTTVRPLSEAESPFVAGPPEQAELVVAYPDGYPGQPALTWAVTLIPNLTNRWAYFVDAQTGAIRDHYSLVCQFDPHGPAPADHHLPDGNHGRSPLPADGPRTATATDLNGRSRTLNTYQVGAAFYLIDGSRDMFQVARSQLPGKPVGVIWTLDAGNRLPQGSSFQVDLIGSGNNTWNDPKAVSAHFNAGEAYTYFRTTFNRRSIDGAGGNILSIINVADEDGGDMDNAYWNGAGMYYGNGKEAFLAPLAKALDVAGHEMSHGVIQFTAGLEYRNEAGAINESYADIFGVMIDRDDWTLGEGLVNPAFYPTGALRDMANPNNGGRKLGDRGWQPAHTREQYTGTVDNGGVHINSGIPNRAFYLFATQAGREKAEQVYYRALTTYLVRSSNFVDLRVAVLQAAKDLYGDATAGQAAGAFDAVGIVGSSGGNYQDDVDANPGASLVMYATADQSALNIATSTGQTVSAPFVNRAVLSKPSVSDDGSVVVYVGADHRLYYVIIDWRAGRVTDSGTVDDGSPVWRNAAISKDGTKLAAVDGDLSDANSLSNQVLIYDFVSNQGSWFTLYNPTTAEGGQQTGDVLFADRLEWDFTGEFLMYDAYNVINSSFGGIDYWDIGFLEAWTTASADFADGLILKLFNALREGVTVGNPSFAKNSPYIIAFDYTEGDNGVFDILGYNIQTGDLGVFYESNSVPGVPNFANDDKSVIFDAETQSGAQVIASIAITADKINGAGNARVFLSDATTGVFFATGSRTTTAVAPALLAGAPVRLYPNPARETVTVDFELPRPETVRFELFDALGRRLLSRTAAAAAGSVREQLPVGELPPGAYRLRISAGADNVTQTVVKGE